MITSTILKHYDDRNNCVVIDSSNQPYKLKNLTKMNDITNVNFLKFAFEFMELVEICHLYIEKFNMIILLSENLSYQ